MRENIDKATIEVLKKLYPDKQMPLYNIIELYDSQSHYQIENAKGGSLYLCTQPVEKYTPSRPKNYLCKLSPNGKKLAERILAEEDAKTKEENEKIQEKEHQVKRDLKNNLL